MRRAALSFLLGILLVGCDKPPPPPPAPPPPVPEPALPPLSEVRFPDLAAVDPEKFTAIPDPAETAPLRWDFSAGKRHDYVFSQVLEQLVVVVKGGDRTVTRSRERNRGRFAFAAGADRTARASLTIRTEDGEVNGAAFSPEQIEKNKPSVFDCLLGEDGAPREIKRADGEGDAWIFFDALLLLREGEKATPDGRVTLKRAGWFQVERYECVRLETEFDFAARAAPEQSRMRGRTVAYFAPREGCFVRASTAVNQSTRLQGRDEKGAWVTQSIDSETSFQLRQKR